MSLECEAGCKVFDGGERKHHRDCVHYPESLTKVWHDAEAAYLAEIERLRAALAASADLHDAAISEAVKAERDRCARIADAEKALANKMAQDGCPSELTTVAIVTAEDIARAIRTGDGEGAE